MSCRRRSANCSEWWRCTVESVPTDSGRVQTTLKALRTAEPTVVASRLTPHCRKNQHQEDTPPIDSLANISIALILSLMDQHIEISLLRETIVSCRRRKEPAKVSGLRVTRL